MNPKFIIGTSYFNGINSGSDWFFEHLWQPNILRLFNFSNAPERIVVIGVAGHVPVQGERMDIIPLSGDLGHCHQFIGKKTPFKDNELSSWEASVLALAMLAYTNETDLVFAEQDMLAFGDWVGQLYRELGERKMLFGNVRCMPCAQSLFIIKHSFLPTFVSAYISNASGARLGEDKFIQLEKMMPKEIGRFSFGYDRDRPLNYFLPVFYGQKFSPEELRQLKARGLINFDKLPENVKAFTNDA